MKPKYKELVTKNLFIVTACYQPSCMYSRPDDTITSSHSDVESTMDKIEMHKAKGASLIRVSKIINQWDFVGSAVTRSKEVTENRKGE